MHTVKSLQDVIILTNIKKTTLFHEYYEERIQVYRDIDLVMRSLSSLS